MDSKRQAGEVQRSHLIWNRCWQQAERLPFNRLKSLLDILAKLPYSADVNHPSIEAIRQAVFRFVEDSDSNGMNIVDTVETVIYLVRRLLQIEWNAAAQDVKQNLDSILSRASGHLNPIFPEHRKPQKDILSLLEELEKPWTIRQKAAVRAETTSADLQKAVTSASWRSATVGWLSNSKLFHPSCLPQMKVPGSSSGGVYTSPKEYYDVVERLWTAMTFGDGNSALSPKCRYRDSGADKECGQALWPLEDAGSHHNVRCRTAHCSRPVVLACANRHHNDGLCAPCEAQVRAGLMGPPGLRASTHVYDGHVHRIDPEGRVYIDHLASRKPPQVAINWRHTGRLCSPNLVGVVKLAGFASTLRGTDPIIWAEIVSHREPKDEWEFRQAGKLAVQPSTITQLNVHETLRAGDSVAVIDCQVFVPEFIPVLKALDVQKQCSLPFEDGALLNLSTSRHRHKDPPLEFPLGITSAQIQELIERSELDPIMRIRRNEHAAAIVKRELASLVDSSTLDARQLDSFLWSLTSPVHLTQGPPGTGKSYLGVVLVRALLIVREFWMQLNPSVGQPPILVLSYKNHAIDEFLLDLVKAETQRLSLIRVGGSCKEPLLQPYSEFAAQQGRHDVQRCKSKLYDLHRLRHDARATLEKLSPIASFKGSFSAWQQHPTPSHEASDTCTVVGDDEQAESTGLVEIRSAAKTAGIEAASFLSTILVRVKTVLDAIGPSQELTELPPVGDPLWNAVDLHVAENAALHVTADDVATLWNGYAHYPGPKHPTDILWRWIHGFVPLPACVYSGPSLPPAQPTCGAVSESESAPLCSEHRCFQAIEGGRCPRQVLEGKLSCLEHACLEPLCQDVSLAMPQQYCATHACAVCLQQGEVAGLALDDPPRNTCEKHPLCGFLTDQAMPCSNLALIEEGGRYCVEHRRCFATVRGGRQCPGRATSSAVPYCRNHLSQYAPQAHAQRGSVANHTAGTAQDIQRGEKTGMATGAAPVGTAHQGQADAAAGGKRRCLALNSRGKPCGAAPIGSTSYCRNHDSSSKQQEQKKGGSGSAEGLAQVSISGGQSLQAAGVRVAGAQGIETVKGTAEPHGSAPPMPTGDGDLDGRRGSVGGAGADEAVLKTEGGDGEEHGQEQEKEEMVLEDVGDGADELGERVVYDNVDDVEEPEHLQHLRDVYTVQDDDEVFEDADEMPAEGKDAMEGFSHVGDRFGVGEEGKVAWVPPAQWTWEMSLEKRWQQVQIVEEVHDLIVRRWMQHIGREWEIARAEFHEAKVKDSARMYEGKSVIGGTIVGCISRLEAIRSTNPFAILVEEASEVLEPLLFVCLVPSTCKLEMIGDHLQLQPSLMGKYSFERINKVNISMFQRLIQAPQAHSVPSTTLSVQRRMRSNICDLTRDFYHDIVEIEDHEVCSTRRIGDVQKTALAKQQARAPVFSNRFQPSRFNRSFNTSFQASANLMELVEGRGREVPGVLPHIYFWTHDGTQQKAHVGLSKINPHEAGMVIGLVKYLVACGVPKSSIAVLTPYKGQLMLVRKDLLQGGLLSDPQDSVIISTVDRFQGDEADVVIVSLVTDSNSRTPFVKLQNRMIVTLSRARLGMFVIGNVGYFTRRVDDSIKHWTTTLGRLEAPAELDTDPDARGDAGHCELYPGPRLGSALPICCPLHRSTTVLAKQPSELKLGFCTVSCKEPLPCTHLCGLRCHWPKLQHNQSCVEQVTSPCARHDGPITCEKVFQNARTNPTVATLTFPRQPPGLVTIADAVRLYRCDVKVQVQLPCTHTITIPCAEETDIAVGGKSWPRCDLPSHSPYQYPDCKHLLPCKCWEYASYLNDPSQVRRCPETVQHTPPCGHAITVPCYLKRRYDNGTDPFTCPKKLEVILPRCGHTATVPCPTAQALHGWSGKSCTTHGLVLEGGSYGPTDHKCETMVEFERKCGHRVKAACWEAFDLAKSSTLCSQLVPLINPVCGHDCQVPCHQKLHLDGSGSLDTSGTAKARTEVDEIEVAEMLKRSSRYVHLHGRCDQRITLRRRCGHTEVVACRGVAAAIGSPCAVDVTAPNPICGHDVKVLCGLSAFPGYVPWPSGKKTRFALEDGVLLDDTVPPEPAPVELRKYLLGCPHTIKVRRQSSCGHEYEAKCSEAFRRLGIHSAAASPQQDSRVASSRLSKGKQSQQNSQSQQQQQQQQQQRCRVNVQVQLPCGHERTFECWRRDELNANPSSVVCSEPVQRPCWNYSTCSQVLHSRCNNRSVLCCNTFTPWTCQSGHTFEIPQCRDGVPQHCPTCSTERLTEETDLIEQIASGELPMDFAELAQGEFTLPAELDAYATWASPSTLSWESQLGEFFEKKAMVLSTYMHWVQRLPEWSRPLFHPCTKPVFVVLGPNQRNQRVFDDQKLVKVATLMGIQVYDWTAKNLRRVMTEQKPASPQGYTLLFGFGFSCHTLVNPSDLPIGKNFQALSTWIHRKRELEGYDSVLFSRHGSDWTVFWEPYPLIATHHLSLHPPALEAIASTMKDQERSVYGPRYVQRIKPTAGVPATSESEAGPTPAHSHVASGIGERAAVFAVDGVDDEVDGLMLPSYWDLVSLGSKVPFSKPVDSELHAKLQVLSTLGDGHRQQKSQGKDKASPFAGVRYLKKLQETMKPPAPELDLLLSLELLHLELGGKEDAQSSLRRYIEGLRRNREIAHPLLLLAFSRQTTGDTQLRCVDLFAAKYPGGKDRWLSPAEAAQVQRTTEDGSGADVGLDKNGGGGKDDVQVRWRAFKSEHGVSSQAMEELLKMIGLAKVKRFALEFFKSALAFKQMSASMRKRNPMSFNFCFVGNAGSGKTTVARHLAGILHDSGIREKDTFIETSAQKLKDDGADEFRKLAAKATGGVLFIDEAYDLDPKGDFKGKPIVSELLVISENQRERLSIILAGYEDEIQEKLYSYNEGLKSRFEQVVFEDFDQKELKTVWLNLAKERGWESDDRIATVVSKRLSKLANRKGFGNARAVRKTFEAAVRSAMARPDWDGQRLSFRMEDVIGPCPTDNPKLKGILDEIEGKIGWAAVKKSVREFVALCETNYARELQGQAPLPVLLNRLFLGNPGTGKTTCAGLYGKLLKQLGFLSVGDVVQKTASDLVGAHVGESQRKTGEALELARGKVLLIDEAYNLDDSLYGKQVLDVLVEKVQGSESDDIAVLLLGYEAPMLKMLKDQNPGLARRFPREYAFVFEDYSDSELLAIFKAACKRQGVTLASYEVAERVIHVLNKQRSLPNFGNAGAIETLLKNAFAKASGRPPSANGTVTLHVSDFDDGSNPAEVNPGAPVQDPLSYLNSLYRVDNIRAAITRLRDVFHVAKAEGSDLPELGHFVFRGSPGTGKTTVARVMSKILYELDILPTDRVQETSGLQLTGEFLGQTKKKVEETLGAAKGGVLFIDEAYELGKGLYGEEAMTSLVAAMTDPQYKATVIIIAGYPRDIDEMLDRNAGLKSRFTEFYDFLDWAVDDCLRYLAEQGRKAGYAIDPEALRVARTGFGQLRVLPGWGNARDVVALWKLVLKVRASRVVGTPEMEKRVMEVDVSGAFEEMLRNRTPATGQKMTSSVSRPGERVQQQDQGREQQKQAPQLQQQQDAKEEVEEGETGEDAGDEGEDGGEDPVARCPRDPNVSDVDWAELEKAKEAHEEKLRRMKREMDEQQRREELKRAQAVQERIRRICPCPMGFSWFKTAGGWRCGGGSHFVSDKQLNDQFSC